MSKKIIVGTILTGLIVFLGFNIYGQKKPDNPLVEPPEPDNPFIPTTEPENTQKNILITDHDRVWDYKRENGVWFTKRKVNTKWLDMKKSLSAEDYKTSIEKLTTFLKRKGRI